MISFCQFGAGRIGRIHAENIARHPGARLAKVIDVDAAAARALAERHGASIGKGDDELAESAIDAVLIASPTPTHADLVEKAARAGKAIFCEKPLDLDHRRAAAAVAVASECGVPLMVGFNRRFDPNFARLEAQLRAGRIGALEILSITSRDPAPPPIDYVKSSGGLFRDMMIHDFDMARWLLGEEPIELFAAASARVDPEIGRLGDVDTALVVLRTASGTLCQISNSRRASYGYDQRIEAFGAKGMLQAKNVVESTVEFAGAEGIIADKPLHFFLERYVEAYRRELDHFVSALEKGKRPMASGEDGLRALRLADAAARSWLNAAPVKL